MQTLALAMLAGCGGSSGPGAEQDRDASLFDPDSGAGAADGSPAPDAGTPDPPDAGISDAGVADASEVDSGARDTWVTFARGFFDTYCVPCHTAGNANRDYTTYRDAYRDRAETRCGVAPGPERPSGCAGFPPPQQFPVGTGPKPSAEERGRFVLWIEEGAPEQ